MADKILYTNKEELIDDESIPLKNKVTADDMNEIKEVVNSHADDIETLETEKADRTEIPTDLSQLSNATTKFVNETQLANAVNDEKTARQDADNIINNTIATISVDYGRTIELSIDSSTFILTATLKNKNGTTLSSSNIDLPIESVVVNGRYDSASKTIILTLQNGNTIEIPVGDLISGLQSEITPQNKLSSDLVDDTNHTNKFVTQAEKNQIETNKNNITSLDENKENISNKVTELTSESTDTQYPSAKAVYDNESALKEKLDRYKNTIETELGDSTDTGTDLTLDGTAEFDVGLGFSGNIEQATNIKTYTCVGTETGDYYFTYNNINYQFTMPTIEVNSILAFNTDTLKLYLGETEITTTTDNTGTLITLQDTPNPEYPQEVQVVKGNNEVKIETGNRLNYTGSHTNSGVTTIVEDGSNFTSNGTVTTNNYFNLVADKQYELDSLTQYFYVEGLESSNRLKIYSTTDARNYDLANGLNEINFRNLTNVFRIYFSETAGTVIKNRNVKITMFYTSYTQNKFVPHKEQTYPITLPEGMEMCKLGDYADEFVYQNNTWYKNPKIIKHEFLTGHSWPGQSENNFWWPLTPTALHNKGYMKGYIYDSRTSGFANIPNYHFGFEWGGTFHIRNDNATTRLEMLNLLINANEVLYYVAKEEQPLEEITDTTLIQQLNNIKQAYTYQGQTNISQTNENLPFIITADFKLSNLSRIEALESAMETVSSRVDLLEE